MTALSKEQFIATFVKPMRRMEANENYRPVPIGTYVTDCIRSLGLHVAREHLQIQHVYLNGDQTFYQVLIHYGHPNRFLVIIVDCTREAVHGHYLLDLNDEYGLDVACE